MKTFKIVLLIAFVGLFTYGSITGNYIVVTVSMFGSFYIIGYLTSKSMTGEEKNKAALTRMIKDLIMKHGFRPSDLRLDKSEADEFYKIHGEERQINDRW